MAVLGGCVSPNLAQAPFPSRADTTEPGSLLGPFDGRVTDAASTRPLPGAVVWVAYSFCRGELLCVPAGSQTWSGETDADGRYFVPVLDRFPGAVKLDHVTLLVYKRGYIGYRSDRFFEGGVPRRDFAQHDNVVKLDPFAEGISHAEHLAFLGGGGPLRAALRSEALQVSVDVGGSGTSVPFDASELLSVEELRQATGSTDDFTIERLNDRPRTARYDSLHMKSVSSGEQGDAALRVFLYASTAEAEKNYEEFAPSLPNARQIEPLPPGLGARAALARDGEGEHQLLGLLVLDKTQHAVVIVQCGGALCPDPEHIEGIAKKAIARLPRTGRGPLPANAPGTKVEAAPDQQKEDTTLKLHEPTMKGVRPPKQP